MLRNIQILAESAKRISPELKAAHAEVDWRGIGGLRNGSGSRVPRNQPAASLGYRATGLARSSTADGRRSFRASLIRPAS